jgi:LysR family glycine cleavage system transcriptional activator
MTHSALGQRIMGLEKLLGVKLLRRTTSRVTLTALRGTAYGGISMRIDEIRRMLIQCQRERTKCQIRIRCPMSFAAGWLLPRLSTLEVSFEGVSILLLSTTARPEPFGRWQADGRDADIATVYIEPCESSGLCVPKYRIIFCPCADGTNWRRVKRLPLKILSQV